MRTTRRLATLACAATAGLTLAACGSTIGTSVSAQQPAPSSAPHSPAPPAQPAADTGHATNSSPSAGRAPAGDTSTGDTSTDATSMDGTAGSDEDLPVPGDGETGDAGLCHAEAGWYGYVGLVIVSADGGSAEPSDVVPFLEQLRDAPGAYPDASQVVYDAAVDVSTVTDEVIGEVRSGADPAQAAAELDGPISALADTCRAVGVDS
jgi:hypothetical protein